jgi:hypothetical protein
VLGFRVSDWFGEIFSFLRCGPDYHTVNLLESKQIRMNHIAFELRDWSHLQTACDFLSQHGYTLILGTRTPRAGAQSLLLSQKSRRPRGRAVC